MYGGVAFFSISIFFLCILLNNNILLTLPTYIMGLKHGQYRLKIGIVWRERMMVRLMCGVGLYHIMNLPDSGYQPDSEFKIRPDPDTRFRYPILIA